MPSLLKIHILEKFKEGPWGGGNQFLKNLRQVWQANEYYTDDPRSADFILLNSYQQLLPALELKRKYPQKIFIHRLGPIFHYHRGEKWKKVDQLTLMVNRHLADWTIFQSQWSYRESNQLGFRSQNYVIIGNAPDRTVFNRENKTVFFPQKVKLISASWSANPHKGFLFLEYLDRQLDFNRYKMTFVGNSPLQFKNIQQLPSLNSSALAEELKKADIFIAPYRYEAASNAILEALACGLPVVALASGSNHEVIKKGGELFQNQEELLAKIDLVTQNYHTYQSRIKVTGIEAIAQQYLKAIEQIGSRKPRPSLWLYYYLKWKLK